MNGHLNGLQHKVLKALHMHYYAHVLNIVLSQSLNKVQECYIYITFNQHNLFLNWISEEKNLFFRCHQMVLQFLFGEPNWAAQNQNVLEALRARRAGVQMTKWQWLNMENFWRNFKQFFYLNSSLVFAHSDILFHILQTKGLDISLCQ
jgi:hypothetical protein